MTTKIIEEELDELESSYTPRRGHFKGQTFASKSDYAKAAAEYRAEKQESGEEVPQRTRKRAGSFAEDIRALLELGNAILVSFPVTQDDALSEYEVTLLTEATDRWQQSSTRYASWFKKLRGVGGWAGLCYALTVISVPRLARHGVLPGLFAERATEYAQTQMQQQNVNGFQPVENYADTGVIPSVYAPRNGGYDSVETG